MRKTFKGIALWLMLLSFTLSLGGRATAEQSRVTYTGNTGEIIFGQDGQAHPDDLFQNFKNVMPGDSLTQIIRVKNNADRQVKIRLYLRSLGAESEEDRRLLDRLYLTVETLGETPVFEAEADETAGLTDWVMMGTLYSGGETDLKVTLTVPIELDNRYQNLAGEIRWQFAAVETPVEEEVWVCPECENSRYIIRVENGILVYVCQVCRHVENLHCGLCGGNMHRVIVRDEQNRIWYYYECLEDSSHHTDPAPYTGDESNLTLWVTLAGVSGVGLFIILILWKRKEAEKA